MENFNRNEGNDHSGDLDGGKLDPKEAGQDMNTEEFSNNEDHFSVCPVCSQRFQSYEEEVSGMCDACWNGREHLHDSGNLPPVTQVVTMQSGEVSFPLFGNLTIAEVVEAYESNAPVKVVSASLSDGQVTLKFEPIPHDDVLDDPCSICGMCHYRLQTDEEIQACLCVACLYQ